MKSENDLRKEEIQNLRDQGIDPFPNDFKPDATVAVLREMAETAPEELSDQSPVARVAGRIMFINRFGKTAFFRFRDRTGMFQAYVRRDALDEEAFALSKKLRVGDIAGFSGPIFKTRKGEWTLAARELRLLCKASRPLPEKFHGVKDEETRYRKRYLDLIMNERTREIFTRRSKIVASLRGFLQSRDFLEVETPMMQPIPGGAEARPFVTHHNALDMDLYLRIAPELYLKRLVVGGMDRVFEINRNFRNEGVSTKHNPEFTMLEFYQAYATYQDLMDITEQMFSHVAEKATGSSKVEYQGREIDFSPPWKRLTMYQALEEMGGVDPAVLEDRDALLAFARDREIPVEDKTRTGKIITKLFDALVEPGLIQPTFITSYPVEVSPLSRRNQENPDLTDRFELFIAGAEIANGFSELNDPEDQRGRFLQQVEDKMAGDDEAHPMDEDYIEALEYGLPPTAGEGVGIDRLTMLLTDSASIREVILFPHMRLQAVSGAG